MPYMNQQRSGFDGKIQHHEMAKSGGGVRCKTGETYFTVGWRQRLDDRWPKSFMKGCDTYPVSDGKALLIACTLSIAYGGRIYPGLSQLDGISIKKWNAPACEEMRCKVLSKSVERYGLMKIYLMGVLSSLSRGRGLSTQDGQCRCNLKTGEIVGWC